jgi:hypothetical protein
LFDKSKLCTTGWQDGNSNKSHSLEVCRAASKKFIQDFYVAAFFFEGEGRIETRSGSVAQAVFELIL